MADSAKPLASAAKPELSQFEILNLGNMDQNGWITVQGTDGYLMWLIQNDTAQTVILNSAKTELWYTQPDCAGVPFSNPINKLVVRYDDSWWVEGPDTGIEGEQTLIKSSRYSDDLNWTEGGPWLVDSCFNYPEPRLSYIGKFHVTYDPPAEWLNAAYPLTLVQKP